MAMVAVPELVFALGVKAAVYVLALLPLTATLESAPPVVVMSEASKPTGTSLKVKVTFALSPALTAVRSLVIWTDRLVVSTSKSKGFEAVCKAMDASTTRATKL